jgi:hypothetical protein
MDGDEPEEDNRFSMGTDTDIIRRNSGEGSFVSIDSEFKG